MVSQVTLLGRAAVTFQTERLEPPPGKLAALLYYVAYQESWVGRDEMVYLFYPDLEEHKARQNLRPLLTKLRRLPYAAGLEIEPTRLRWNVPTDVGAFRNALESNRLAEAVQHYRGALLNGFHLSAAPEFESWLELERSELQRSWREAALTFAAELENQGRHHHAAEVLNRLHKTDALDEAVFRHYFTALARAGNKTNALQAFETFKKMLNDDVASEPERETLTLVEQVRSGRGLLDSQPTTAPAQTHFDTFRPALHLTSFVGRETEIGAVMKQLGDSACRLLTILAPGGMGKTRLAVAVGERLESAFEDGVYFVPFDAVTSPSLMVSVLADALHFSFFGPKDPKTQLLEHLKTRTLLLVLDNLEHLLEGASLVTDVLQAAPNLTILATSRERLNLHAEWVYDLTGMSVPEMSSSDIGDADAVKLFVQTARKARADFSLDASVQTVAHICRALGGLPLALELAASWLRVLSVEEVAGELAKGLALLESSLRDLPERHHDLRAVFDTSWQRLSADERAALQKLTVFQGGLTKEAAEAVAETSLPLLLALTNKSFLQYEPSGRFAQHPLIRQYLRDKRADDDVAHARHAAYFATFMQRREGLHQGIKAKRVRAEIIPELPNLRAAWFWAAAQEREDLLDQMSEGLLEVYTSTGRYREVEDLFRHAAATLHSRSTVHGRILRNLGHVHNWQLEYAQAAELLRESIAIFQKYRAKHDEALALSYLTMNYDFSSHPSWEVQDLREKAVTLFRELGDKNNEARQLSNLGEYYQDPWQREHAFREAIRLFREVDGYFGITLTLCNLAFCLATAWGAYREAETLIEEAVAVERERGMAFRLAWWLNYRGHNDLYQGHLETAEKHFDEARSIGDTLESGFGMWELEKALAGLGRLSHLRGDLAGARELFTEALLLNTRHADPMNAKIPILLEFSKLALTEKLLDEAEDLCLRTGFGKVHSYELYYYTWEEVGYLSQIGDIAAARGEVETSRKHFYKALAIVQKWHFVPAALQLCVSFANLARRQGNEERAVQLLKLATNHPASMFETKEAATRGLSTLSASVDEVGFAADRAPTLEGIVERIRS